MNPHRTIFRPTCLSQNRVGDWAAEGVWLCFVFLPDAVSGFRCWSLCYCSCCFRPRLVVTNWFSQMQPTVSSLRPASQFATTESSSLTLLPRRLQCLCSRHHPTRVIKYLLEPRGSLPFIPVSVICAQELMLEKKLSSTTTIHCLFLLTVKSMMGKSNSIVVRLIGLRSVFSCVTV